MPWQYYSPTRTVRGKLLIAFTIVVALNIAAGMIGWRGFRDTDQSLEVLQSRVIPDIDRAVELARRSSALAALAPFVGSVQVMNKLDAESKGLVRELDNLKGLVRTQTATQNNGNALNQSLGNTATELDEALRELIETTHDNLSVRSDALELRHDFQERANIAASLGEIVKRANDKDEVSRRLDVLIDFHALTDLVFEAGTVDSAYELIPRRQKFDSLTERLTASNEQIEGMSDFVQRQRAVFDLRQRELDTLQRTRFLLASIHTYSGQLNKIVSAIVQETTQAAGRSWSETAAALDTGKSRIVILGTIAVLLGAVTAVYIVSTLAHDLGSVTKAMSSLAKGDRTLSIPGLERKDEIGELTRAFNVFKEHSTERELLAERLAANSQLLEAMFANLTDGLSVFDADLRLIAWNPQVPRLLRLDPSEFAKGVTFTRLLFRLNQQQFEIKDPYGEEVEKSALLHHQLSRPMQYELHFTDGRVLELRSNPMPQGGFITMYSDLTDRRAVERQLRVSQRMEALGQLTGGIAHDFNNLLGAVSVNLQLLQESFHANEEDTVRVLRALDAVERATTVTHRLLAFSRQQALKPECVAIDELIGGLLDLIGYSLGHQIELKVSLNAAGLDVFVDPAELENAILNLVFNGRDAMHEGGTLEISTDNLSREDDGEFIAVTVRDEGVGMTAEVAARAAEPFFTTKGVGNGTGLGLSMVYGFVEQSGGQTKIASEVNIGTEVSILLPRYVGPAVTDVRKQTPSTAKPRKDALKDKHILFVEDNSLVRHTAMDMLQTLGYAAEAVGTAQEAIDVLNERPFDLLITDVMLPDGFTGLDVADHATRLYPKLQTVFVSGFAVESIRKRVPLEHSATILQKPFRAEALAAIIPEKLGLTEQLVP
jgi:signal transduction histidine kinase